MNEQSSNKPIVLYTLPNAITALNLMSGCVAVVLAFTPDMLRFAPWFILLAAVFDFCDGFVARLTHSYSDTGKELDSLADVVSFGVAPGVMVFQLMRWGMWGDTFAWPEALTFFEGLALFCALLIPVFAAYRLAKFNVDERQHNSFMGLPTPASAFLIVGVVLGAYRSDLFFSSVFCSPWLLAPLSLAIGYLNLCEVPMIAFKFKSWAWSENKVRYSFLVLSLIVIAFARELSFGLIIILYVLFSIFQKQR
jgi:CDP-diacylglycerol--serine O-phosphatidyltransferase